jgi:hypothetical protein
MRDPPMPRGVVRVGGSRVAHATLTHPTGLDQLLEFGILIRDAGQGHMSGESIAKLVRQGEPFGGGLRREIASEQMTFCRGPLAVRTDSTMR